MAEIGYFDIETADADSLYLWDSDAPFIRLCGAASDSKEDTGVTDDPAALLRFLERASAIVGHNVFRFDLPALARHCGADYDVLAAKTVDTAVLARLADPPTAKGMKNGYYSLDAVAQRLGVPGKSDDLRALALEFGPERDEHGARLSRPERVRRGYALVPTDDKRYREYLRGDVRATRAVHRALPPLTPYAQREMKVAAIQNRMSLNGWRVDEELLAKRVFEEEERRQHALRILAEKYGVPVTREVSRGRGENKVVTTEPVLSPLASDAGKAALVAAFRKAGAPFYPRTATGDLAISSDALGEGYYFVGKGREMKKRPGMLRAYGHLPEVGYICELVSEVTGASAKYAEISRFVVGGRVHGRIGEDQASGRWAMKRPSLTNLGKRGGKVIQRAVFLPEPGHVLLAADFAQVDMRALAGLCQDPGYMALFEPGKDVHAEIAEQVFGDRARREDAKPIGHGWNYGRSVRAISESTGIAYEDVARFDQSMTERFPGLTAWRDTVRAQGEAGQFIDNGFGRAMRCDPDRAYTQAPALAGQGCARDIMCEGLLRMVERMPEITSMFRAVVHDEVVVSVPEDRVEEVADVLRDAMTFTFRGVPITADVSAPGTDWAACYAK